MKPLLSITSLLAVLGALSVAAPQAAAQGTTTTTLTASPNPVISGKPVTFTANVQTNGSSPLTGFVDLGINGNFTPGLSVVNGVATTAIPFNTVGTYVVVATYTGDANNASSSAMVSVAVQAELGLTPTTITVATSANPAEVGEYLTYTATVAGNGASTPTGTVNFFFGSGVSPVPETLGSNGKATASTAFPTSGDYPITATYSGDANNAGSTSVAFGQTVSALGAGPGLSFVPVTPCRIADTRTLPPWTLQRASHRQQRDAQLSHTTERMRHSIDGRRLFAQCDRDAERTPRLPDGVADRADKTDDLADELLRRPSESECCHCGGRNIGIDRCFRQHSYFHRRDYRHRWILCTFYFLQPGLLPDYAMPPGGYSTRHPSWTAGRTLSCRQADPLVSAPVRHVQYPFECAGLLVERYGDATQRGKPRLPGVISHRAETTWYVYFECTHWNDHGQRRHCSRGDGRSRLSVY